MKKLRMSSSVGAIVIALALVAGSANAHDVDEAAGEAMADGAAADDQHADDGWEFSFTPYLWLPGAIGTATVGGETVKIESTVGDTLDLLGSLEAGGAMAHFDAHQEDLGVFVDFAFLAISTTDAIGPQGNGSVRTKILQYFVEYGATYRILDYPTTLGARSPIWVELLAGGRWNRITTELAFSRLPRDAKSKIEFMDPLVGGRFSVPFYGSESTGDFGILARGDIGGFGAGSDLSWSAVGALQWKMPWTMAGADLSLLAGYKTYYYRVTQESDGETTSLALQNGGPALGLAATF